MAENVNNDSARSTKIILICLKLAFRIALPLFDSATDIYTLYRYYHSNKPLMFIALIVSFSTIVIHNIISTFHGIYTISQFHEHTPLSIWKNANWKCFTVVLHALGFCGIIVPVEIILLFPYLKQNQLTDRYLLIACSDYMSIFHGPVLNYRLKLIASDVE